MRTLYYEYQEMSNIYPRRKLEIVGFAYRIVPRRPGVRLPALQYLLVAALGRCRKGISASCFKI
jgi:hypothetical protein